MSWQFVLGVLGGAIVGTLVTWLLTRRSDGSGLTSSAIRLAEEQADRVAKHAAEKTSAARGQGEKNIAAKAIDIEERVNEPGDFVSDPPFGSSR